MNDKIKGIVLNISDYKEADALLRVLTKDNGILSFVARGAKKIASKNHFFALCEYEFIIDYKDNKTIYSIHNGKLLNRFYDDNLNLMAFKNILVELTLKNEDVDSYEQLLFVLDKINDDNLYLLGSLYFSYFAKASGIMPYVDGCVRCHNKKVVSVSNKDGGFLCEEHSTNLLEVERLKKFRLIVKGDFKHYDILKEFSFDFKDFELITDFYLDNYDLRLKSYEFYKKLI